MNTEFILCRLCHTPKFVLLAAMLMTLLAPFSASAVPVKADPNAVNTWGNGKLYFFENFDDSDVPKEYLRYDIAGYQVDSGYPKPMDSSNWSNWPSDWSNPPDMMYYPQSFMTAGVNWGNGKAYFFSEQSDSDYHTWTEYIRVDVGTWTVDDGYPKPFSDTYWPGMPVDTTAYGPELQIDAAVNMGNGKAYFFHSGSVICVDIATHSVDWYKGINEVFPNLGLSWVDGVANWGTGKIYFFVDNQYWRYDLESEQIDSGYPKAITEFAPNWSSTWLDGKNVNGGYAAGDNPRGGLFWGTGGMPLYASTSNVVSNHNPSKYGEDVTFTAHVTHSSGSATLLGTVTFLGDDQAIFGCVHVPLVSGVATCTYSSLPVGSHTIKVNYSGDANYMISSDITNSAQVVNKADTVTTVYGGPNPSRFGQSVTFDAYITPTTGSAYPQGTVTFYDGTTVIPGCGSSSLLYGGIAYCTTAGLRVGSHPINTYYGGNSNFKSSLGMFSPNQVVNAVLYLPLIRR